MSDNIQIAEIVEIYLAISSTHVDEHAELAQKIFEALQKTFKQDVPRANSPIILPYKDITDVVFYSKYTEIKSHTIEAFKERIDCLIAEISDTTKQKTNQSRLLSYHKKLVGHILLAQAQKEFITKTIIQTDEIAKQAKDTAKQAKDTAKQAKDTAQKAEETYKSMFANYVTILGIFTAIIVTVFGGLNVISVALKQENFNLNQTIFLTVMAFMCVVSLLYFLANMIAFIKDEKNNRLNYIFGAIVVIFAIIMLALGATL